MTIEQTASALDKAMSELADAPAETQRIAEQAIEQLNLLHRDGLVQIVQHLKADERGKELLFELVDKPEVRMLFAMHQIIRPDPETLARQTIENTRSALQSHGGDVEFSHLSDGVVHVRLQGACNGCSMAAVTMREGIEKAVLENVPGVTKVEVLPNEPSPALIPLGSIGVRPPDGWVDAGAVDDLDSGALRAATLSTPQPAAAGNIDVVLVNLDGQVSAFRNACAHQGKPLDEAIIDVSAGTLTCPWHGLCYDASSGECLTLPGAQLSPLPVRISGGRVLVRPES